MAGRTRPTIHDVASAAGVSATTVSHAMNGKSRVAPRTRARVQRVARELGYVPDYRASSLRSGRTATLGFLLPVLDADEMLGSEWFSRLSHGMARAALGHHHALLLIPWVQDGTQALMSAIDGAIVSYPCVDDERLVRLRERGVPTVTVGRPPGDSGVPYAGYDTVAAATELLDHLTVAGASRIALLLPNLAWGVFEETRAAYSDWCARSGHQPRVCDVDLRGARSFAEIEERVADTAGSVLGGPDRPDAILCGCEGFAAPVVKVARELNLRVPEDLLVAQDTDEAQARGGEPAITVVDTQPAAQAAAVVELVLGLLSGAPAQPVLVSHELKPRASTARSASLSQRAHGHG